MMNCLTCISCQTFLNAKELSEAFKDREERCYRINELHEINLKISRDQIVKVPDKVENSAPGGKVVAGPPLGGALE